MGINKDKHNLTILNSDKLQAVKLRKEAKERKHKKVMDDLGVDITPFPGTGSFMALDHEPASKEAKALTDALATMVHAHTGGTRLSSQRRRAVGAIAADLTRTLADPTLGYCYRSTGSDSFDEALVGEHAFRSVRTALVDLGFMEGRRGYKKLGAIEAAQCSRFKPQKPFADLLATHGINPALWTEHFTRPYVPIDLKRTIVLRGAHRRKKEAPNTRVKGHPMAIDWTDAAVLTNGQTMLFINEYLSKQYIDGARFTGLRRKYNNGDLTAGKLIHGGRMFDRGGFQNEEKKYRHLIRINGQITLELDYLCCQPAICYALLKRNIPNGGDVYASDLVIREVMKRFARPLIGGCKLPRGWSKKDCLWYSNKFYGICDVSLLRKHYPARLCRSELLKSFDILQDNPRLPYTCYELQNRESDIMVEVVRRLAADHDVPALPIHDSIIIPAAGKEAAEQVMRDVFHEQLGAYPAVRTK